MNKNFNASAVFCEDIRQEAQGIVSLIGVLPDNVGIPGLPGGIPKLGIYTRVMLPVEYLAKRISLSVRDPDGKPIINNDMAQGMILDAQQLSLKEGAPFYCIVAQFLTAPFQVTKLGRITVHCQVDEESAIIGWLNFIDHQQI